MVKFLSDTQYAFTLEPYDNGTPVPTVVTKEVGMIVTTPFLLAKIEVMKTEFMWCQTLTDSIKAFEERKDNKGKDTFDLSDWWKSNSTTLPGFTYVFRVVLSNSPNFCPTESLFSIFNVNYNDDQKSSNTDYIE
jgi:hypothetical protein